MDNEKSVASIKDDEYVDQFSEPEEKSDKINFLIEPLKNE